MKFGICSNMHGTVQDPIGITYLEAIAKAGFDYVELPLAQVMDLEDAQFENLCKKLSALGLKCLRNNNFFPAALRLTGPDVHNDEVMNYITKSFSRAGALGSKIIVFGSGPAKNVPDGFPMEKGYEQLVKLLQYMGDLAYEKDMCIAIEPLNKSECNIINTFEEGCGLSSAVSHKRVRVLVDYYHLAKESEPVEHLYTRGKQIPVHVHFAEPEKRSYPIAQNAEAYSIFFRALKDIGYDETISIEAYDSQPSENMYPALLLLRKIWEQADF